MSDKRFEITEYGSDYYIEIIDNEKELDESIDNPSQKLGLVECADLLNNLHQENIKLKEEIKAYPINEQYAEEIIEQNQKLRIERNDLRRENEQLKNRLNEEYIKECSIK